MSMATERLMRGWSLFVASLVVGAGVCMAACPFVLGALAWKLWAGGTVQYLRDHGELSKRTLALVVVSLVGTLALSGVSLLVAWVKLPAWGKDGR